LTLTRRAAVPTNFRFAGLGKRRVSLAYKAAGLGKRLRDNDWGYEPENRLHSDAEFAPEMKRRVSTAMRYAGIGKRSRVDAATRYLGIGGNYQR